MWEHLRYLAVGFAAWAALGVLIVGFWAGIHYAPTTIVIIGALVTAYTLGWSILS